MLLPLQEPGVAVVAGIPPQLRLIRLISRIPVVIQPGNIRAILAGDNSNYPKLIHLRPGAIIDQGERIVTSGHGGAFPPGLPVGLVKSTDDSGIVVRMFSDRTKLVYIRLLDYGIRGIVEMPPVKSGVATTGQTSKKTRKKK